MFSLQQTSRCRTWVACALVVSLFPTVMAAGARAEGVKAQGTQSGTVRGTTFYDRNADSYYDGPTNNYQFVPDSGVEGIIIRAFDSTGAMVGSTTSSANGTYTLSISGAETTDIRLEFEMPDTPAFEGFTSGISNFYPGYAGTSFSSVRFVTIGQTAADYAVTKPSEYCQNNPGFITCLQPMGDATGNTAPGAVTFSANLMLGTDRAYGYSMNPNTVHGLGDRIGSVFGIGVDPLERRRRTNTRPANAFMGTYVKRHSEYGDYGPTNTIYHVTIPQVGAGTVSSFITLPGTLPAHDATAPVSLPGVPYSGDTDIFPHVGRIGLGDVDVTDDASTVLAVDMNESAPKFYFIPLLEDADGNLYAGTDSSLDIPRPATFGGVPCLGKWHPMGIGTRDQRILVGGVCGAEDDVTPSEQNGPHLTRSAAFVLEYNGTWDASGSFTTIFATSLGYERGCTYLSNCSPSTSQVGDLFTADWGAWNEYPVYDSAMTVSNPQAMLANIEIADNGDLILGLRDRFADQVKAGSLGWSQAYLTGAPYDDYPDPPVAFGGTVYNFAAGDMLRVCNSSGVLSLETGGTCSGLAGSQFLDHSGSREYYFDNFTHWSGDTSFAQHTETVNGSLASIPGYNGVWTTAWDISFVNQQGVLSFGSCDDVLGGNCYPSNSTTGYGSRIGGLHFPTNTGSVTWPGGSGFAKGNGLADLEVICDEAPVMIGNGLWDDIDKDGIWDAGEPGLAGVTVNMYDSTGALVGTAVTDSDGFYAFMSHYSDNASIGGGLTAGEEFVLRLDNPDDYAPGGPLAGYELTIPFATTDEPNDIEAEIDSNAVPTDSGSVFGVDQWPTIYISPLSAGETVTNVDFGVTAIPTIALGDVVWIDADGDGIQDGSETGLAGVTVELFMADGTTPVLLPDGSAATATTDENGAYLIDGILPGDYVAKFTLPEGYGFTAQAAGTDSTLDSDPDRITGFTAVFTLVAMVDGDTVADDDPDTVALFAHTSIDAGVVPLVGMGNYTWIDSDRDGIQDISEPPLAGVVVTLYESDGITPAVDAFGNPATATTDDDGHYFIDNLLPGDYRALFTLPDGYAFTAQTSGSDSTEDSNPDRFSGLTPVFTIATSTSGETVADTDPATGARWVNPTIDAGVYETVAVGNLVWNDLDGDGIQDPGEPGVAGVVVTLYQADGSPALDSAGQPATATTDANGYYLIDDLVPGTYVIGISVPSGWAITKPNVGGDATLDSNVSPTTRRTAPFTLGGSSPSVNTTLDAGLWRLPPMVSVGDKVWHDSDRDGVQDRWEKGVAGAVLRIYDANGRPARDVFGRLVPAQRTTSNGLYSFNQLPPGRYVVRIQYPKGMRATAPGRGTAATDSSSNFARSALLRGGQRDSRLDFGVVIIPRRNLANTR